ncbi:hypothetical protein A6V39_01765 [Candidatus Mycoplasma haematobovis]|uniref:Type I restriction modification DNA specificity domain-containing protein n=1 Tax=Candidatus Mycoplasma haematobovis TaxID=432608 RepID=A0A1A9QGB3_9MOLU|nr:restriction endonuclease subunit S [Candidatus Mycoplasma haematobovis]OAL10770.1 hypothetical protein A6V39_01765 [Candidatus Mycoplasma haematobovis]
MCAWEIVTLDNLGILKSGRQVHKPEYDPSLFCEGSVPLIESQLIENDQLFVRNVRRYYNTFGVGQSTIFEADTVCITRTGNVAKTSIIKVPSCLSSRVHGLTPFVGVSDAIFIKYSFDFSKIKKLCQNIASANTETKVLTIDRLLKILFPNPPFELQQKIGKILSTYDLLIENYQRQIEEAKKQVVWKMIHTS